MLRWFPLPVGIAVAALSGCFNKPEQVELGDTTGAGTGSGATSTTRPTDSSSVSTSEATGSTIGPTGGETSTSTAGGSSSGDSTSGTEAPPGCGDAERVLFINFDGQEVIDSGIGVDNAPEGLTKEPLLAGPYGPYVGGDRQEVFSNVQEHFAPYGLCTTDVVPSNPDYDMLVVTSDTFPDAPGVLGFPNLDCDDLEPNNLNVLFLSDEIEIGSSRRAIAISKFAAALYGLEDVGSADAPEPEDIMNRFVGSTNNGASFTDTCLLVESPTCAPGPCGASMQNSSGRLTTALGSP